MNSKLIQLALVAFILLGCRNGAPEAKSGTTSQTAPVAQPSPQGDPHAAHDHAHHEHHALEAAKPLAGQSLYNFKAQLTDQDGKSFELASLRGSAVLATMFYASCTSICPMLIGQLKHIDETIPDKTRAQTQVMLVSLDPARDTPENLKQLAKQHGISDPRWHFLRAEANDVRELAALLGIRYRQLPSGEILHSPLIALLDREGVIAARQENAADDPAPLLLKLDQTLAADVPAAR